MSSSAVKPSTTLNSDLGSSKLGAKARSYPDVTAHPNYPLIEQQVLAAWKTKATFQRSIDQRPGALAGGKEFVFYDGPPFANGLPHYGHLLTGYVKDVIPRFQTMRGKRVERRFGWDCHGLPAEMEAEKELKVSGQKAITEFGIDKFNAQCRRSVLKYTKEWEQYVTRQARWVDFERDYKTMDLPYMESVIWAFKQLWNKGLIYEGYRVMPYSWACETPLSNFEIRLDNATRPRQDPAITVAFRLDNSAVTARHLLVWTTTPWTLPSNLAVAVGPEIDYEVLLKDGVELVIGAAAKERYLAELGDAPVVAKLKGCDLVGATYVPLFPYFASTKGAFRVLGADFVTTSDGTGLVHLAPGFGEEDQKVCEAQQIAVVCPVDERGCFTEQITEFAGLQVFDANKPIAKILRDRGQLFKHDTIVHNYPHCWRTDTPIIYRAITSWYVRVTDIRERMVELNKQITWIPEHIRDGQFGKWLENARDWSISRNRFWGAPIPVWRSDDARFPRLDVYGSLEEIERDFGVKLEDLHRPGIDALVRPNPDDPSGQSSMRRVPEVLDCWFESGSMPFAQIHYPFENKNWFNKNFPADFIVEYVAQTRGWFYTLMVLGTALFDKPPFLNCICHGVVLDEHGQKLSKRLRNYPSPEEVCNKYGADALRWFLISSPILRGLDLQIDKEGKAIGEVVRTVINPIWNAYYFFALYANSDGIKAEFSAASQQLLDQYIIGKLQQLVGKVEDALETYQLADACQQVVTFLEALNNWYIRRSRERFWRETIDQDKIEAYNTLYTVLYTLCRVIAPLLPMISEEIYQGLSREESVHLADWPDQKQFAMYADLVSAMDQVRDICSVGLGLREKHNLRTRLPLRKLVVAGAGVLGLKQFSSLIADELNVKEVEFVDHFEAFASRQLQVNAKQIGPKFGSSMKAVLEATRTGSWKILDNDEVQIAGQTLLPGEYVLKLQPLSGIVAEGLSGNNAVVVLDVKVDQELLEEGMARDLVRAVQQARKDAGLHVADKISLSLGLPESLATALRKYEPYIADQTLASLVEYQVGKVHQYSKQIEIQEHTVELGLSAL